jgi:hypothetical protein
VIAVAAAVLLGLVLTVADAQEPGFADTPAGRAFKARQYGRALAELERMVAENPRDPLALRYLGITLDRLGRYRDAIAAFRRALALEPQSAALHYHLGVTYYKSGAIDLADEALGRVLKIAADSLYGDYSRRYLEALAEQRARLRPGAPAPFGLFAEVGVQYDSNIPAAPSDRDLFSGKRGGVRVLEYVAAEYRFVRSSGWLGIVGGSTYQAQYPGSAFDELDLSTYSGTLFLQKEAKLGTVALTGSVRYAFDAVFLGGDGYSRSHVASAGLRADVAPRLAPDIYYRFTRDDFDDEGFDPAISSRDADNHAVGVGLTWHFGDRKGSVRLGYEYQSNRADGINFDFEGHKVAVAASAPIGWEIQGALEADYTRETYDRFQGPVHRKTDRWRVGASLSRWLWRGLFGKLTFGYTDEDSSYAALSYRRWVVGASVGYSY